MGRYSAKPKANAKKKKYKRGCSTARRGRDLDLIHEDIEKGAVLFDRDDDLPGGGQYYCVSCARHFVDQTVLEGHMRSKPHKRRVKVCSIILFELTIHSLFTSIRNCSLRRNIHKRWQI